MRRILIALAIAVSSLCSAASPAGIRVASASASYYLALGDSLARGYQPNHDSTHGYAQDLLILLQKQDPGLKLENLGCSGESSSTMLGLNGAYCPNWQQTTGVTTTPQITQAVTFLKANQVRLITLDIGADDILTIGPHPTLQQFVALYGAISHNLAQILARITATAPGTRVIVMTYYNPFAATTNSLIVTRYAQLINEMIAYRAAQYGAGVAKVYGTFNNNNNPAGHICAWTWYCSTSYPQDPHPTSIGYAVISEQFLQAGVGNV